MSPLSFSSPRILEWKLELVLSPGHLLGILVQHRGANLIRSEKRLACYLRVLVRRIGHKGAAGIMDDLGTYLPS